MEVERDLYAGVKLYPNTPNAPYDVLLKIALVGARGIGMKSFAQAFYGDWSGREGGTTWFSLFMLDWVDKRRIKVQLWIHPITYTEVTNIRRVMMVPNVYSYVF
jgi:hypothetical protein